MEAELKEPFYKKLAFVLISLALICIALIYGKDIILPILFAILLANILLPLTHFLSRKKFNKALSIFIPLFLAVIVSAGVVYFLSSQIINFMQDMPALKERVNELGHTFQVWIRQTTGITIGKQDKYIQETMSDIKDNAPGLVGSTFDSLSGIIVYLLVPLYTFLILYYKENIKLFLIKVFKNGSEKNVTDVLSSSTKVAQQYITGLMIETTLVFAFNTAGFLILGIKYAIFLALLAALLNLIPYVGILIANILCMLITLVTSDSFSSVVWVGVILAVVQFLDNNIGMPLIVGNKVRINALVTITGVLVGGALCGIPGMFLAIPGLAVLKVIFDRVPDLEPWGMLLGDEGTKKSMLKIKRTGQNEK